MAINILTIGNHSFINLYNWALSNSQQDSTLNIFHYSKEATNSDITVKLNDLQMNSNEKTKIKKIETFSRFKNSTIKFDFVIMYCSSLEEYSEILSSIVKHSLLEINSTKIIIENTGSIPLNNFVSLSLPEELKDNIDIYYSLNKVNFRPVANAKRAAEYELKTSNNNKIQLSKLKHDKNNSCDKAMMQLMSKVFKPYQIDFIYVEDSNEAFNDLWRYSIFSIVIQPLMIMFELESLKELEKFILCKPLLKGLFNELSKIYGSKTSSEDGSLKNLKSYFKWLLSKDDSLNFLELIQFDNNMECSFDLNILYPILLADEMKIKIPYMEFLYSVLQQLNNYRFNKSNNFISKQKYTSQLEQLTVKLNNLESQLNNKVAALSDKIKIYETDNGALNQRNENLNNENDALKHQLEIQVSDLQKRVQEEELLKNDFLEQLSSLKIAQNIRKSFASQLQVTSGDEDEDFVDARDNLPSKTSSSLFNAVEITATDQPTTPHIRDLRKSRSIQGVNAQFSSPKSNTEAGIKALKEVQIFSEYGIYYGSPDKAFATNGTNSTDTAVNEKDLSLEPQNGMEDEDYEEKTFDNGKDVSMDSLKQRELELEKRELLLEQRERMMMSGDGKIYPPPPKQHFPPIPRKASAGNFNKQVQIPTALRMSYMPQQPAGQQPLFDVNGNIVNVLPTPITPTGNAPFNPQFHQKGYIPKQQQMFYPPNPAAQQYNIAPPQLQGRSISQPGTTSGNRILSNGSGGQQYMQPQQQQQQQQQPHHPQYAKTSRKNRASVMIPSASKLNKNPNFNMLNMHQNRGASEVLVSPVFDDFGPYSNNNVMQSEGHIPMMVNNSNQRMMKSQKSYQNLSKKSSCPDMHSSNMNKGNMLPPGFTNTSDLNNSNGSSSSLPNHGSSPLAGSNVNLGSALREEIKEVDENASSVMEHSLQEKPAEQYEEVNSDEFKLDSLHHPSEQKVKPAASLPKNKNEDGKKHIKLSNIFGRRKTSV